MPSLIYILNFHVHIATATSQFVLMITSLVGTLVHIYQGTLVGGLKQIIPISIGAVLGSQVGARISKRLESKWITITLAIALALIGIKLTLS